MRTADKGGADEEVKAFVPTLFKVGKSEVGLWSARGSFSRVCRMPAGSKPSKSRLRTTGVYLYDDGFQVRALPDLSPQLTSPQLASPPVPALTGPDVCQVIIWCGQKADTSLRASAFTYAQHYLKMRKRPPVLPITQHKEGKEPTAFTDLFGPEEKDACCVIA